MKQPAIHLSDSQFCELRHAIESGFSDIALALAESLGYGTPAAVIASAIDKLAETRRGKRAKTKRGKSA